MTAQFLTVLCLRKIFILKEVIKKLIIILLKQTNGDFLCYDTMEKTVVLIEIMFISCSFYMFLYSSFVYVIVIMQLFYFDNCKGVKL